MTIQELQALVGKTGRVNVNGLPWLGEWIVTSVDSGRVTYDDLAGDHLTGPTVTVESVERRVQHFADGRPPLVIDDEPALRCEGLAASCFTPNP
jgi:hypothetical protein